MDLVPWWAMVRATQKSYSKGLMRRKGKTTGLLMCWDKEMALLMEKKALDITNKMQTK